MDVYKKIYINMEKEYIYLIKINLNNIINGQGSLDTSKLPWPKLSMKNDVFQFTYKGLSLTG